MSGKRNIRKAAALMAAALLLAGGYTEALAAEDGVYENYLAGTAEAQEAGEREYTVIEIASEADLAELAAGCTLDVWSRDKYVKLTEDISLQDNRGLCIPSEPGAGGKRLRRGTVPLYPGGRHGAEPFRGGKGGSRGEPESDGRNRRGELRQNSELQLCGKCVGQRRSGRNRGSERRRGRDPEMHLFRDGPRKSFLGRRCGKQPRYYQ